MEKVFFSVLAMVISGMMGSHIHAQERPGDFELGIIIGEPTGLSAKYWTASEQAFDFGLAWSFRGTGSMHLHSDYLMHRRLEDPEFAIYYGLGARLLIQEDPKVAIRVPGGVQYFIPDSRIGLFFELAPMLNLLPDMSFEANGGLGIRFFF